VRTAVVWADTLGFYEGYPEERDDGAKRGVDLKEQEPFPPMSEQGFRPGIGNGGDLSGQGRDLRPVLENLQAVMKHHGDEQEEFDGEGDCIEIVLGSAWHLVSQNQVGNAAH